MRKKIDSRRVRDNWDARTKRRLNVRNVSVTSGFRVGLGIALAALATLASAAALAAALACTIEFLCRPIATILFPVLG